MKSHSPTTGRRAFTLVEVVLALGIASIGMIGIFSLTQAGLVAHRDAMNSSIGASIAQQVASQYLLASFDSVSGSGRVTQDYDQRGIPVEPGDRDASYRSEAVVEPAVDLGISATHLLRLRVEITSPTQPNWSKSVVSFIPREGIEAP